MTHRVRSSSLPAGQPVTGGDGGSVGNVDPNAVVEGARDRFEVTEPGLNKLSAAAPVIGRSFAEPGDPILRRHMTEVLIRALGMTMAQIDEPGAKEAGTSPSLRRS